MILLKKQLRRDLNIFLSIVIILLIMSFIFIYSSSSVYALEKYGSATYFLKKQILGLLCGLVALFFIRWIPLDKIKTATPYFFFGSLGITALTLIPGLSRHIHGSSRWLNVPGFAFQPSELLKLSLIMYLAYFVIKKERQPSSFIHNYLPILFVLGLCGGILLLQPDFGLTVTLVVTSILLLCIAHYEMKYLIMTMFAVIPIGIGLILMRPYRLARILTFLNPWADPQGSGFQIIQSLIAIGSGGLWGLGIGQSKQKFFYLPMQHTDFIFSIIAEETGFIGSSIIIILFILLLYFGLRIACRVPDIFCSLTILGFSTMISLQAAINLAVTTGLAPTKGIGLPFISYGNTALVCELAMIGLIINMVYEAK